MQTATYRKGYFEGRQHAVDGREPSFVEANGIILHDDAGSNVVVKGPTMLEFAKGYVDGYQAGEEGSRS